jgi:hypothetical protein
MTRGVGAPVFDVPVPQVVPRPHRRHRRRESAPPTRPPPAVQCWTITSYFAPSYGGSQTPVGADSDADDPDATDVRFRHELMTH